jgi:uncharacterized protein with PQ loop repeat
MTIVLMAIIFFSLFAFLIYAILRSSGRISKRENEEELIRLVNAIFGKDPK